MKKDRLSEFIGQNRSDFDHLQAPDHLWSQIEQGLDDAQPSIRKWSWHRYAVAAMFALLLGSVFYIVKLQGDLKRMDDRPVAISLEEQEQNEALNFYAGEYQMKKARLKAVNAAKFQDVEPDLKELEAAFLELKKELGENYKNEQVIKELINNYQLKIKILEKMLDLIEQYPEEIKSL